MNEVLWKENWEETRQHFIDWWNHKGLVIGRWSCFENSIFPREIVEDPGSVRSLEEEYTDPILRSIRNHKRLASSSFPGDILPLASVSFGPGSFALFLGSTPEWKEDTVWYHPFLKEENLENYPPLKFNPENRWFKATIDLLKETKKVAKGRYFVPCPDLIENIDTLVSLRGTENLLLDMIERPEEVKERLKEINNAWFEVYDRIYDIIKLPDNSSCFEAFRLYGPGKTAKVQCDTSSMFSPSMFEEFVVPYLREQCSYLDYSMFHLDGHQCLCHLDLLLSIPELDAIEWTPDPQVPGGTDPVWFPMYKKILLAKKSVQILGGDSKTLKPVLDEIGGKGVYFLLFSDNEKDFEECLKIAEEYR